MIRIWNHRSGYFLVPWMSLCSTDCWAQTLGQRAPVDLPIIPLVIGLILSLTLGLVAIYVLRSRMDRTASTSVFAFGVKSDRKITIVTSNRLSARIEMHVVKYHNTEYIILGGDGYASVIAQSPFTPGTSTPAPDIPRDVE